MWNGGQTPRNSMNGMTPSLRGRIKAVITADYRETRNATTTNGLDRAGEGVVWKSIE